MIHGFEVFKVVGSNPHKAKAILDTPLFAEVQKIESRGRWNVTGECVPTRFRLQSQHVQCEMIFPWCNTTVEDDWHAFVGCTMARESWNWAGLLTVLQLRVGTVSSLADFALDISRSESQDIDGRVVLLFWQIWAARNDVIWNDAHHTSMSIGRTSLDA
ncbi:hypothetical protein MTR_4g009790 [Medicago truncatula]|uniref:Reverse transcriptase zinc-binding domain-containing protein n=1 Tax=Medicago truncatula TaxID=3880 RepID=G7JGU6_MEDTR|nr:hypothetical protein MTR_4g009790 [Medicago truncatula]